MNINKDQLFVTNKIIAEEYSISLFEYFYVLVLILYGGMANTFFRSFTFDKPISLILPVVLSTMLFLRTKIVFNKQFFLLLVGYMLYNLAITIKFMSIHPLFFGYLFINFFVTYVTIKSLKFKFFLIYENLIYLLSIFSLIMWSIQLVLGGDNLFLLFAKIPSIDTFSSVTSRGLNLILYTVQPISRFADSFIIIPRNCGFAWEPGGFAVYICLGIFINLFFLKTGKRLNNHFWVMTITLLSTQSTTGYVIFIIIIVFYFLQSNIKIILLLFPIIVVGVALMFSLPFMRDKIMLYFEETTEVDYIVEESVGRLETRHPQRFASLIISLKDFKNHPLLGYGGKTEERWYTKLRSNIYPISGIGNLMAQYGLVGTLFFIILLNNTSKVFSKYFNYRGAYFFLLIIMMIAISYRVILFPVIMSFWMYSFFESQNFKKLYT